jgi:hypothetical protein
MSLFTRDKVYWKENRQSYIGYDDALRTDVIRLAGVSYPLREQVGTSYFVDSATGSNNNTGRSPQAPVATLDYAIGLCTANKGDRIYVMPNHAETVTGAGGITADVAGIKIIGLGHGNQRPRFLMDGATTVTFVISAADVWVENLVFASGHSDVATCIDLDAAGCHLINCEFVDNTTHENFLVGVTSGSATDNVCDGLTVRGCRFVTGTDSHTAFMTVVGDIDHMRLEDNVYIQGAPGGSAGSAGIFLNGTSGDDMNAFVVARNWISCGNTATDSWPLGGGGAESDCSGVFVENYVANRASVGTTGAASQNMFTKARGLVQFLNCWHTGNVGLPAKRMPIPTDESGWY